MDGLEDLLERSPRELNFFSEGVAIGRVGVHLLSKHAAATPRLTLLELRGSSIGHQGAVMLAKGLEQHPCITHLGLARNSLDTPAIQALLHALRLSPLRTLDLEWNGVDNAGAAAVAQLLRNEDCELRTLSLERNDVRPSGAGAIAVALKTNKTLRNLNLGFNRVGNGGAVALGDALLHDNTTLLTLNLTQNDIGGEGGNAMLRVITTNKTLRSLNLQGNQCVAAIAERHDDDPDGPLRLSESLRELNLHSNKINATTVGEDLGHLLQASHRLAAVCLAHCEGGDAGMAPVLSGASFMASLSLLDVSFCGLGVACYPLLGDVLAACPALHTIIADHNHLGAAGAQALASGLKRASSLTNLSIDDCSITSAGADAIAVALEKRTGLPLRELHIAGNRLDTDSCAHIASALLKDAELIVFGAARNAISIRAAPALLKLLERHRGLMAVGLRDNPIADLLRVAYVPRDVLADYLEGPDGAEAAAADTTPSVAPRAAPAEGDTPDAIGFDRSRRRLTSVAGGAATDAISSADMTPVGGDVAVNPSSVHYNRPSLFAGIEGCGPQDPRSGSGQMMNKSEDSFSPLRGSRRQVAASGAYEPELRSPGARTQLSRVAGARGSSNKGGAVVAASAGPHSPPRPPPVALDAGTARTATPGLSAVTPVPFAERRVQLHDVESNIGELCVSENQLRLKFAEWDVNGDGTLDAVEFRKMYLAQLVVPLDSDARRVDTLLAKYVGKVRPGVRVSFDVFSVMMLHLAAV